MAKKKAKKKSVKKSAKKSGPAQATKTSKVKQKKPVRDVVGTEVYIEIDNIEKLVGTIKYVKIDDGVEYLVMDEEAPLKSAPHPAEADIDFDDEESDEHEEFSSFEVDEADEETYED